MLLLQLRITILFIAPSYMYIHVHGIYGWIPRMTQKQFFSETCPSFELFWHKFSSPMYDLIIPKFIHISAHVCRSETEIVYDCPVSIITLFLVLCSEHQYHWHISICIVFFPNGIQPYFCLYLHGFSTLTSLLQHLSYVPRGHLVITFVSPYLKPVWFTKILMSDVYM